MKACLKSISTLLLFIGLMIQPVFGQRLQQNNTRPDEAAKIQVDALTQSLNLNGTQQRALFRILVTEATQSGQSPMAVLNKARQEEGKAITRSLQSILTAEQFRKWRDPKKK